MLIHSGNHLGDSWYYVEGEIAHCFYLTCPEGVERHTAWDIGHATSRNLKTWQIHDLALSRGEPDGYDGISPATGSVIRFEGRYWLAYSGNWQGPRPAVAVAVSDDLYRWEKIGVNPVTTIDTRYYDPAGWGARTWPHWRDPFLFKQDGFVYHYVCARAGYQGSENVWGTLGLARTEDMHRWEVLPPPEVEPVTMELECPQVHRWDERYYLLFSAAPFFFSESFLADYPEEELRWSSYSMVGPTPFGPFRMHGNGQIISTGYPLQPYANQLLFWQGEPFLLGTVWNDEQDFICDPLPLEFRETGVRLKEL